MYIGPRTDDPPIPSPPMKRKNTSEYQSQANAQRVYNERVATPQTLRTREQVARFFAGLELVDPGLVQVHQWRPGPDDSAPEGTVSAHGAVARKPGA